MKIRFNNLDEFIKEIEKDKDKIHRGIVRLATVQKALEVSSLYAVKVIAAYRVGDEVVELEQFCGNWWREDKKEGKVWDEAKETCEKISKTCKESGLEIRAGVYEAT